MEAVQCSANPRCGRLGRFLSAATSSHALILHFLILLCLASEADSNSFGDPLPQQPQDTGQKCVSGFCLQPGYQVLNSRD